jgi:WD40 repeat protein
LVALVQDAHRFIMYHKQAVENYPLQVYASALLFSPSRSVIRNLYKGEELQVVKIQPDMADEWSACRLTLESHSDKVTSVAISYDSRWVVTGSWDNIAKISDASSGKCVHTLEGHSSGVTSVAISHDSRWVVTGSDDRTAKIWEASSGKSVHTLEGHSNRVTSVAISHDSRWVVTGSWDKTAKIWEASSGECMQTLETRQTLHDIAFDAHNQFPRTAIGPLRFDVLSASKPAAIIPSVENTFGQTLGVSGDGRWITFASENLVWLPSEYRPSYSAVSDKIMVVDVGSGKVWMCSINI